MYGTLVFGFILSCAGFYYLKRDFNHPTCVLKPQPLAVLRWVRECIDLERRRVPQTMLGTVGFQLKRVLAEVTTDALVQGLFM